MFISKVKQCYNAKPSAYHFYVKKKILVDFHICIAVPLSLSFYPSCFSYMTKKSRQHLNILRTKRAFNPN